MKPNLEFLLNIPLLEESEYIWDEAPLYWQWTTRVSNVLKAYNFKTVRDLVRKTPGEILALPNIGENSLAEIRRVLSYQGLTLGMEIELSISEKFSRNLSLELKGDYLQGKIDALQEEMVQLKQLIYPLIEVIESVKKLLKT